MIGTLQRILEGAFQRLSDQVTRTLPPLLAALTIVLAAYLLATAVRWLLTRAFKGAAADRFIRESGLSLMLDQTGQIRCAPLVARGVYWLILLGGLLTGLSAFDTALTTRLVEATVLLLPKIVSAALILLLGAWLAQYLGRTVLVWGVNDGFPSPRRLAVVVRTGVFFLSIVVAAEVLDFARSVFLAAFVIFTGGAVLAASLALGLGARDAVGRYLTAKPDQAESEKELAAWRHL
jgi:Mechanosensitive ion channel, conserved TM helix